MRSFMRVRPWSKGTGALVDEGEIPELSLSQRSVHVRSRQDVPDLRQAGKLALARNESIRTLTSNF